MFGTSQFFMYGLVAGAVVEEATEAAGIPTLYERIGAFSLWLFNPVFAPINRVLAQLYQPWAYIVTIIFFLGTWVWVAFILKKEYVNLSCPYKTRLADLRIWTLVAMAPHLFVYLYFR